MDNETKITQAETVKKVIFEMTKVGLDYGSFYRTPFLKEAAGEWGGEKVFPFFMIALSAELRQRGMHISCAELGGEGYRICQSVENFHVAAAWRNDADKAYDRAITLLSKTDTSALTEAEKIRDENALRILRHERRMLARSEDVVKTITRHKPSILRDDIEAEPATDSPNLAVTS